MPWNAPLMLSTWRIAPALAAGNTVVLKPAPDTPWCATVLGRLIAEETDIPLGVVNVVPSADHALGAILFENTMEREIEGRSTADYLWDVKQVVPFLKVDQGLAAEKDGVQLMNPVPTLGRVLGSTA